ncbi:LysR family transcriptional regulator [Aliivibrio kagoshimensis]|uniref:LysR family transcriptional regulator n=1 Tax=Aliivibrio kagoshimensis TaxID=2910230 RepID=UPI003D11B283
MDWLDCVQSYVKVVDEGSFSAAARQMNTSSSALSKRLHWLEGRLGVQLLKRTTRSLSQTEAGLHFYQRAKQQLDDWQSLVDETRSVNQSPTGVLKIGATIAVGSKLLVRYFDGFLALYPNIKIQLITTIPGQLPELSLDIFISRELDRLNSLSFKATPLFKHKAEFFVSPKYVKKYGVPQSVEELDGHNVLVWGEYSRREVTLSNGQHITMNGNFATTNPEALFHSAKRGMGILLTGRSMIREEIESGELNHILKGLSGDETMVHAYYPKLDNEHTRTQLFIRYLKEEIAKEREK